MKAFLPIVLLLSFGAYAWGNTPEEFAEWKETAENGDASAQWSLGVKWYRKAAEQGHPRAQWRLGDAYEDGEGVIEDKVQAYAWYNIAAANGDESAKKTKTTVAELMTKEQIAEAQKLSREMIEANPKLMGE